MQKDPISGNLKVAGWFPAGEPTAPPTDRDLYFNVHPVRERKTGGRRGTVEDVLAINHLYCEFDIKDGWSLEWIQAGQPEPSIIIDSGHGWHCYWLLEEPVLVTDINREEVIRIQKAWVEYMGGDKGASDLARVLRVPGTYNAKNPNEIKRVAILHQSGRRYSWQALKRQFLFPEGLSPSAGNRAAGTVISLVRMIDVDRTKIALSKLKPWRCDDYAEWLKVGMALHPLGDKGLELWDSWSKGSPKYEPGVCRQKWEGFEDKPEGVTLATLFYEAEQDSEITAIPVPPLFPQAAKRLTVADAFANTAPMDWVVQDLLAAGSLSLIFGDAGIGKTFLTLDLAVCIAQGTRWLQFATSRQPVLLIDEESGKRRMAKRIRAVVNGHHADRNIPLEYITLGGFDFGKADSLAMLHQHIEETMARLVIIDALVDVAPGRDENAVKDILPVLLALRRECEVSQCAILLIHHSNKTGKDPRGSTSIRGAVDLSLKCEGSSESPNITISTDKARDIEPVRFAAKKNFGEEEFYLSPEVMIANVNALANVERKIMEYLKGTDPSDIDTIVEAVDYSQIYVKRTLRDLVQRDLLVRTGGHGRGDRALYAIKKRAEELPISQG